MRLKEAGLGLVKIPPDTSDDFTLWKMQPTSVSMREITNAIRNDFKVLYNVGDSIAPICKQGRVSQCTLKLVMSIKPEEEVVHRARSRMLGVRGGARELVR